MPDKHQCPECGAILPDDAPEGLCPGCLMAAGLEAADTSAVKETLPVESKVEEEPGQRIDRYRLLQKLGEGGCGVVYMAEQTEPVRRKVALKVIKLGMDTRQVIARFEAERQALALMDHPNIARVLDAGTTERGRPYFVMELVKGIRITDYCDQNKLSTLERLTLFTQVCQAIQHAHQKGIIHRDIKPSNILVTLHDGVPVPKVIDFGIAKATEQPLTEKTVFTAFGQFMGTPAYMSPEQAELSGLDIDTRSDIYSLGVLLYELLTGRTPFDAKELLEAGLDEMRRRIREEEPVRPSTRLSTMIDADLTEVAWQRQSEPGKFTRFVRGDLDWIVMKCLEKDRNRRYETANGLAMDLRRHLDNEPVQARPPSAAYRFRKLVRRNKLAVVAASAVVAALVVGLTLATWQFLEKSRALKRAIAAEKQTRTEAVKSQQVAYLLKLMLDEVRPSVAAGQDTKLLRRILDQTSQRISEQLTNQPEVEADLRLILGQTYEDLGEFTNALAMTQAALRLRRACFGPKHVAVAEALNNLAAILYDMGDFTSAEARDREALEIRRELLGPEHPDVALSLNNLGLRLWNRGDFVGAEEMQREALRIRRKALPKDHPDVAKSLNNLAMVLWARGDFDDAEPLFAQALAIFRNVLGTNNTSVAFLLNNLGTVRRDLGRLEEAETMTREAWSMRRKLLGARHSFTLYSQLNLAIVLQREGNLIEAESLHRDALTALQEVLGTNHQYVAESLSDLAMVLAKKGDLAAAEAMQRDALATAERALGKENEDAANALDRLALLRAIGGDLTAAGTLLSNAVVMTKKTAGETHPDRIPPLMHLSWILKRRGDPSGADSSHQEAMTLSLKGGDYATRALTESCYLLADLLQVQGRFAEAEPLLLDASACVQTRPNANRSLQRAVCQHLINLYETWDRALPNAGKSAEAEHWRKRLAEIKKPAPTR